MTAIAVRISRLVHSKANVRRTERAAGLEELVASIAAHGQQNLNVRPISGGRYEVVAGGWRLLALKQLVKEGRLSADTEVPCLLVGEGDDPSEISLVENAIRRAMHPDDQCAAFQALMEQQQLSVEDIAAPGELSRKRLKGALSAPEGLFVQQRGEGELIELSDDEAVAAAATADMAYSAARTAVAVTTGVVPEESEVDEAGAKREPGGGRSGS